MGQYSGGSGTHLTLIHPWLNVFNSFSTYGLPLHTNFITLPAKLRGLRDDIAIKGWRVLMSQLPWKLLVSSPTRLHYFQLCSQLQMERMRERQKSLCHFSSTSRKENGGSWAPGKREIHFRSSGDGVCRELGCRLRDCLGVKKFLRR